MYRLFGERVLFMFLKKIPTPYYLTATVGVVRATDSTRFECFTPLQ